MTKITLFFFQNSKIRFDKDMVKDLCNIKFYNISLIDFSSYFLLRALYRIMLPFLSILYIVIVTISKVFRSFFTSPGI